MVLIAFVVLLVISTVLKKHSSTTSCSPGANATCVGVDLAGDNLAKATLTGANFAQADLADADLHLADLTGANLRGADLAGADLTGATLSHAQLRGANLTSADLAGAIHAHLKGATVCHTLLPSGHFPVHDC